MPDPQNHFQSSNTVCSVSTCKCLFEQHHFHPWQFTQVNKCYLSPGHLNFCYTVCPFRSTLTALSDWVPHSPLPSLQWHLPHSYLVSWQCWGNLMSSKKIPSELERTTVYNLKGDDEGGGITASKLSFRSFFPSCGFEGQKGRGHILLPYWKEPEQRAGALEENNFLLTSTVTKSKQNFGFVSKLPSQRRKISVCPLPKLLPSKKQRRKKIKKGKL